MEFKKTTKRTDREAAYMMCYKKIPKKNRGKSERKNQRRGTFECNSDFIFIEIQTLTKTDK